MVNNQSSVPGQQEGDNVSEEPPRDELLSRINSRTGRDYEDLNSALKGIEDTYSFVGSEEIARLRSKAEELDKIQQEKPGQDTRRKENELYERVDRMEFLYRNPDAEPIVDMVAALARSKSLSFQDAYENTAEGKKLRQFAEKEKKEQEAQEPSFAGGGRKLPPGEEAMSLEEFSNLPLEEQEKIVRKLPGFGKALPKQSFSSRKKTG